MLITMLKMPKIRVLLLRLLRHHIVTDGVINAHHVSDQSHILQRLLLAKRDSH